MSDEPNDELVDPHGQPGTRTPGARSSGDELRRRLAEQVADFEARIHLACQPAPPIVPACNKIGARKDASFKAISTAPSINWTPVGACKVPLPYQTVQDLSNSISTAQTVKFNGLAAYLLDHTTQPNGTGDERGTAKGIRSGTVTGEVKPVSSCTDVRIEGKFVVREGDKCTMNGGNNSGVYVTQGANSSMQSSLLAAKTQIRDAIADPSEGTKGLLKSFANTPPDLVEMFVRASKAHHADELRNNSYLVESIAGGESALLMRDIAKLQQKASRDTELPKFRLSNNAQQGGEKLGILAQLLTAGVGLLRVPGKMGTVVARRSRLRPQSEGHGLKVLARSGRVSTAPDEAFFWSGRTDGIGGQDVAAEIAKGQNGTTLEMLIEKNKITMPSWDPNDASAIKAWEDISAEYAAGASGRVRAVIGSSLRPGNIWETKELPRLMSNPKVTEIITIDPVSRNQKTIFKRQ